MPRGYRQRVFKEWRLTDMLDSREQPVCDQARTFRKARLKMGFRPTVVVLRKKFNLESRFRKWWPEIAKSSNQEEVTDVGIRNMNKDESIDVKLRTKN